MDNNLRAKETSVDSGCQLGPEAVRLDAMTDQRKKMRGDFALLNRGCQPMNCVRNRASFFVSTALAVALVHFGLQSSLFSPASLCERNITVVLALPSSSFQLAGEPSGEKCGYNPPHHIQIVFSNQFFGRQNKSGCRLILPRESFSFGLQPHRIRNCQWNL